MEQTIQSTLKKWEASLKNFGKVDQWDINKDYAILGSYIAKSKSNPASNAVRDCRDYSIKEGYDADTLLSKVQNANRILSRTDDDRINKEMKRINSVGQSKRFVSTTKKLYNEKLRFNDGKYLRDIDVSIADGATSRKVRRIVEKRMCQAYHRQNKDLEGKGRRDSHYMKRATSFQLYNLGQIDRSTGFSRTNATHWKKIYDQITGEVVFKKKMEYSSMEEAEDAAKEFKLVHSEDRRPVNAYKCAFCGKWHIGHTTADEEKTIYRSLRVTMAS